VITPLETLPDGGNLFEIPIDPEGSGVYLLERGNP
jgi:hypothetical protein